MIPSRMSRRFSWRFVVKLGMLTFVIYLFMELYAWSNTSDPNPWDLNYFLDDNVRGKFENLIDTPKCKILQMSPWEAAILPFIEPKTKPPDCNGRNRNWSYLQGSTLILNESGIHDSGYSLNSIRCCYKRIIRVEQTLQQYDQNADNDVKYSDDCKTLDKVTNIESGFIRVFCFSTSWPFLWEVIYREFYAIAAPTSSTRRKMYNWEQFLSKSSQDDNGKATDDKKALLPPSVVMIGIDSISRMNFYRSFNETKGFLEEIGAVEFKGYTKVGENTHPNTVAFLTGYSYSDLAETCLKAPEIPQEFCPYIWKRFDKANYITATVEDAPELVGFNYLKMGFVDRPTDFYFRPFMLAVHKSLPRMDYYHTDCIGRLTTEETLLNYIQGIMNFSSKVPVFIHSWMTSLAHSDINGGKFADSTIAKFFKSADLSNTILIFMSDHGQRYGAIRETLAGWYEDKLPMFTIYLPPTVTAKFPHWKEALLTNSKRLTSPFDLYRTMEEILDVFTTTKSLPEERVDKDQGKRLPRKYGQSLFSPINKSRSCQDAGIQVNFCACVPPRKLNSSDPQLTLAAKAAVAYLNQAVPSQCLKLKLDRISAGALMTNEVEVGTVEVTYVVTFYTQPGDFMFEANVNYDNELEKFSINTDLLRMNRIVRDASCVSTSLLERYCYCA